MKPLRTAYLATTLSALALLALPGAAAAPRKDGDTLANKGGETLARIVPSDVFLYIASRPDPSRAFVGEYWRGVCDAFQASGAGDDLIDLGFSLFGLDDSEKAEAARIQQHVADLLDGIDWEELTSVEYGFVERMGSESEPPPDRPPTLMANMVWLSRGAPDGIRRNRDALVALFEGIAGEANARLDREVLGVTHARRHGAEVASMNLFAAVPGAPSMAISIAARDGYLVLGMQDALFDDVLAILDGDSGMTVLADDPRFQSAFAALPPAGSSMTFFDVQDMLSPIQRFLERVSDLVASPSETTQNTGMNADASRHYAAGLAAYRDHDPEKALAETEKAHEASPESTVILYNLACFHALSGHHDEALDWLEKAVEGGFYAPRKIAGDSDLRDLRGDPRYASILARARDLAARGSAGDVVRHSANEGETYRLRMQVRHAYEEDDYELGLKLAEQAYAISPEDSQVLYSLACLHMVLGHDEKGLEFLDRAVRGGFYCPQHIAKDPDLESVRDDPRYRAALSEATKLAAAEEARESGTGTGAVLGLMRRLADAAFIVDHTATVEFTRGASVHQESITSLLPGAASNPIYPFFGRRRALTRFDRFLPRETASFSVGAGYDWGALYDFLEDTFRDEGKVGGEILAKWEAFQETMGIDLRKDVLGWIGGETVNVTLEGDGGSVFFLSVTDPSTAREKIAAAIDFASTDLLDRAAEVPPLAMLSTMGIHAEPLDDPRLEGFQILRSSMSADPLAIWGVTEGYLVVGSRPDGIAMCLATARGEHPGIRENSRVMEQVILPDGPFTNLSLVDQRRFGEDLARGLGVATMVGGMMGLAIPDPGVRKVFTKTAGIIGRLSPVVRKIDFFESKASLTTFDGAAWHTHAVTNYVPPEVSNSVPPEDEAH